MCHPAQFTSAAAARAFILAGNATVTLVSRRTGARYTYRVRKPTDTTPWFVSVLYGPDNETAYTYMGMILQPHGLPGHDYRRTAKARIDWDDTRSKAWRFMFEHVFRQDRVPAGLEIWHEGRCGRCARKLTVPSSIASGFGPECVKFMAVAA